MGIEFIEIVGLAERISSHMWLDVALKARLDPLNTIDAVITSAEFHEALVKIDLLSCYGEYLGAARLAPVSHEVDEDEKGTFAVYISEPWLNFYRVELIHCRMKAIQVDIYVSLHDVKSKGLPEESIHEGCFLLCILNVSHRIAIHIDDLVWVCVIAEKNSDLASYEKVHAGQFDC